MKNFRRLPHQFDDRKVLRTYALTLPARDAVGSLSASLDQTRIEILGSPVVGVAPQRVDRAEDIRDTDSRGTSVTAVFAGRTSDLRHFEDLGRHFINNCLLLRIHRLKVREGLNIVLHLRLVGHAGQNRHHAGLRADKAERPGGG